MSEIMISKFFSMVSVLESRNLIPSNCFISETQFLNVNFKKLCTKIATHSKTLAEVMWRMKSLPIFWPSNVLKIFRGLFP